MLLGLLMKSPEKSTSPEVTAVEDRYALRHRVGVASLYNPLNPDVFISTQERERALIELIRNVKLDPLANKRILEVGCGSGSNLLQLIKLGAAPENLVANELLPERIAQARRLLPASIAVHPGDACQLSFAENTFDIVLQSTVFSSLLDDTFQARLAEQMWHWTKPGGGILWYDFTYNNPRNPDVRGMPLRRIRDLFPEAQIRAWRLTLAPPLSRRVTRLHPNLYHLFNLLPFLRTHLLCWIAKPRGTV